jgi:methylmalonyl-CoA mutase cobalamin-binding subunit
MSVSPADPNLMRALKLSQDIMAAAENADMARVSALDGERMRLVQSFKLSVREVGAADSALLGEILQLNDQALGLLEHQRRAKGRELDMAAVGRRAVTAYSHNR